MKIKVMCPYCNKQAPWISNEKVYGKRMGKSYMCYHCKNCDAYVGCHQNSKVPLGTMANKELRKLRMKAHQVIDEIWKSGMMTRKAMYKQLRKIFGEEVHIGWADENMCKAIIQLKGGK